MNKLIESMLRRRGCDDPEQYLRDIDACEHQLPGGVDDICRRLAYYRETGGRVVLLTDFDCDGIMSGVIGFAGLCELGINAGLYFPSTENYGFGAVDIDKIHEQFPDARAILTGDVGVTAAEGADRAAELGIEMLVTDHHKPGVQPVSASVIVDPMCDPPESGVYQSICGAHVMLLVLQYFAKHFHPAGELMEKRIARLRVFAGIGTVSDSMPVFYENRRLIRETVNICRLLAGPDGRSIAGRIPGCEMYRRAFMGLYSLMTGFAAAGKFRSTADINEEFLAFYLTPAVNSVKRLHGDVGMVYTIFFGDENASRQCVRQVLTMTENRKHMVDDFFNEMTSPESDQPWAPYIWFTDAGTGIMGLLAQRLRDMTGEPALVVGRTPDENGEYRGSGRSPDWFPFLTACAGKDFVHAAGHEAAFGVFISSVGCADLFSFMRSEIQARKPSAEELEEKPDYVISTVSSEADTGIDISLFMDFLNEIENCRPFGSGFPAPEGTLEFRPAEATWEYLGRDFSHIKVTFPQGLVLLCFGQAGLFPSGIFPELFPETVTVQGHLSLNVFNGFTTVQFIGTLPESIAQTNVPAGVRAAAGAGGPNRAPAQPPLPF